MVSRDIGLPAILFLRVLRHRNQQFHFEEVVLQGKTDAAAILLRRIGNTLDAEAVIFPVLLAGHRLPAAEAHLVIAIIVHLDVDELFLGAIVM